jgi:hypothetical protein
MVERFIAPVLKTGDPKGSVGSNPTPSAKRFAVHGLRFTVRSLPVSRIPPLYLCAFGSLADVAKGGDGAKSALRENFLFLWWLALPYRAWQ